MKFKTLFLILFLIQTALISNETRTIEIYSSSDMKITPDIGIVFLGITTEGINLEDAKIKNDEISKKVEKLLKDSNISKENIQLENFSIDERYEYIDKGRVKNKFYEATKQVKIYLNTLEKHNLLLENLTKTGVSNLRIEYRNSKLKTYKNDMLKEAVSLAFEKAKIALYATKEQIDKILEIEEIPLDDTYYGNKISYINSASNATLGGMIYVGAKVKVKFLLK